MKGIMGALFKKPMTNGECAFSESDLIRILDGMEPSRPDSLTWYNGRWRPTIEAAKMIKKQISHDRS